MNSALLQSLISRKKVLMNFSIYFASSILNRALPFFLLPVITHYLTPEEYGTWSLFQVMITFVSPFVGMNMQNCITRNFYRQSQEEVGRVVSNILLILGFNVSWTLLLIGLFASQVASFQGIATAWLLIIPLISLGDAFLQINITILRNQNKAFRYGAFQISSTAFNLGLTLFFVVALRLSWDGLALATIIESSVLGLVSLVFIQSARYLVPDISKERLKEILRISIPFVPHVLSAVIMNVSDRIFINQLVDTQSVGIYSVGYQFGMVILLITDSFNLVWTPWMYRQLARITEARKRQIVKYTYLYNLGIILLAVLFSLAAQVVIPLVTAAGYHDAQNYVLWVSLGYAFRGMYMMVFAYLVHEGKTSFLGVISSLAAVFNLAGNYVLIQNNGAVGAAQSTLIAFVILYLGVWWYSARIYPMPWFSGLFAPRPQA